MNNPAGMSTDHYIAEHGDADRDSAAVLAIWHQNLNARSSRQAKFDWFYRDGPWGPALFQMLRHPPSGQLVGTAAIGRRRMLYKRQAIRAGILSDMAVDTRHRSLGPAMILQTSLAQAAAHEFDFLYGFPNRSALPVMKRLGYTVLARMPRLSRVLRHRAYLQRHVPVWLARPLGWLLDAADRMREGARRIRSPALRTRWSACAEAGMDVLWQASAPDDGLVAPRDTATLHWRFDRFPATTTRYLLVHRSGDDTLLAWFACQQEAASLHVRDFWSVDAAHGVGRTWIAALVRAARAEGFTSISVEYAAPSHKLAGWRAASFIEREHRLIVGRWTDAARNTSPDGGYHFTSADEDE